MARGRGLMSEQMKRRIVERLGVADKALDGYYGNLTSKECGSFVREAILVAERHLADDEMLARQ